MQYAPYWHTLLPWKGTKWRTGLLSPYLKSDKIAACPEAQRVQFDWYHGTYGYNGYYLVWGGLTKGWNTDDAGTSLVLLAQVSAPSRTICLIDSLDGWATSPKSGQEWPDWNQTAQADRHNGGWNVSFCDGHTKWYTSRTGSLVSGTDALWALEK
jgi:prepilin-type processing-associated H-X9-DG protein